jgi:transcriptional regulator with XRE-family HTH domain
MTQNNNSELGILIKSSMLKQGISLRQLSKMTGISAASLSKIINNKQSAGLRHIRQLSKHLNIPVEHLLFSVGIELSKPQELNAETHFLLDIIKKHLQSFGIHVHSIVEDIRNELNKYEHYAQTDEGREIILQQFMPKLATVKGSGLVIEQLKSFYQSYCSESTEDTERAAIGSVLLYFALSPDVIPDYAFPLGYLDDAIAVNLVADRLMQVNTEELGSTANQ